MDNKQARYLHQMLDRLAEGKNLSPEEIALLRKELPELPKQKTLEEIAWDMDFAWSETSGNDWKEELFGDLEPWLAEQHTQLRAHLEGVKSQAHPTLPDGMRIADHKEFGRVVATDWIDSDNEHFCVYYSDVLERGSYVFLPESSLTFIDTESAKPEHPEFLETEADYENAPKGTVVAQTGQLVWVKDEANDWTYSVGTLGDYSMSKSGPHRVLRWGWSK